MFDANVAIIILSLVCFSKISFNLFLSFKYQQPIKTSKDVARAWIFGFDFLFIAFTQSSAEGAEDYYNIINRNFTNLGCNCEHLREKDLQDAKMLSPLVWAYVGDSVYELFVRTKLTNNSNAKPHKLHIESIKFVKAKAQADILKSIMDELTEEEKASTLALIEISLINFINKNKDNTKMPIVSTEVMHTLVESALEKVAPDVGDAYTKYHSFYLQHQLNICLLI